MPMTIDSFSINGQCQAAGVMNIISVSGGKDSLAMWLLARESGVEHQTAFADTGHEHPQTMEYLDYLERSLGPIRRVWADFTARIEGKRRFIAEHWPVSLVEECGFSPEQAAEIIARALEFLHPTGNPFLDLCLWKGRFPSTRRRLCTTELKHEPIRLQVVEPLTNAGTPVISWQGVRAQESPARAGLPVWEEGFDIGPRLAIYRPIIEWTQDDFSRWRSATASAPIHYINKDVLASAACPAST